ncbi:autotransporter outer membrane beta-barrel domain-containing protein, partial [Rickettsia sp. TH2014]|uniref:autotransporter outer membrane beta-barrel domain-containing protein n=1 Tax=Rickettsia sp. TH2014 TaxID=1967503 RepID=UPI001C48A389
MLTKLKFSGAGASSIPAANAQTIEVANAGANVTASSMLTSNVLFSADGSLVADKGIIGNVTFNDAGTLVTTGISGAIDCNSQAATINFSGDKAYILKTPIQNAENATLDVNLPKLTMIDLEVGSINISDNKILAIDLASGNKTLLAPGGNGIKFLGANSTFQIDNTSNNDARVASFAANLAGDVGGGGILLLNGGTQGLTITGDNAPTTIGVPGNEIAIVETQGIVTMQDSMDASSVSQLNIVSGSNFTDKSCSTAKIPNINIGTTSPTAYLNRLDDVEVLNNLSRSKAQLTAADSMRIAPPSAIYAIDVSNMANQNLDILGSGQSINFIDENATVKLSNVSSGAGGNDRSITLLRDLDSGKDDFARVELSASTGSTLTVKGGSLGTDVHKLKQLELSGEGVLNIESTIHTTDLELNVPTITLADVHSNLSFATNTTLTAIGNIDGNVDFQNNAAIINISDGQKITGNVNSTGGNNGTINFEGKGAIDGVVTNLTMLKAGAGDVTFKTSGDYSITELQGNGSGTIAFPSNMKYVGGMNITGGQPVNLNLTNNNIINGNIGSSTSPVGNIASGANTEFNGSINSIGDIKTSGEALFAGNVACNNILANTTSSDALSSFSLFAPANTNVHNTINFDQDNVITKFQGTVHTKGGIKASGSTYFADTVNSQGNITINGDTKFNKTLSSGNNIDISHGSNVIFNGDVSASTINVNSSNIQVSDNISIAGNISASNSSIILDNKILTLSGINIFTNQLMINTTYDESSLSGGNIILAPGSTLDLSNVSELIVKLSFINSDISKIADNTIYNIILAEDGSNIVPLNDPEHQIILDSSGEQNKFVKWKLDASALTLYAYDDSNNVIDTDYVFDSAQDNMFMQELKHVTTNSDAEEFKKNIGLLDKEQAEEMLSRILDHPKERDSAIVQVALHQTLTDTNKVAMNTIHNRLSNTGLGMSQAAIAAGDEDMCGCNDNIYEESKYGMWARSSINHSKDKVSAKNAEYFSSYKTKGHSNTIGLDSLICDNILLGIAYTNAYTSIRPKDQSIGNIDKVRTNMFSLYSAYNIPNYNWYLNSTISYAESSIRSGKIRYTAITKNVLGSEVASGKYKSHLYNGSISLGYNHYLGNNAYVVPSIGAIASLIRDKGYTETGTSFQNLTIRKKNYHKLSSIAGLRAYQDIYFGHVDNVSSLIVTPEAYGFINY